MISSTARDSSASVTCEVVGAGCGNCVGRAVGLSGAGSVVGNSPVIAVATPGGEGSTGRAASVGAICVGTIVVEAGSTVGICGCNVLVDKTAVSEVGGSIAGSDGDRPQPTTARNSMINNTTIRYLTMCCRYKLNWLPITVTTTGRFYNTLHSFHLLEYLK